MPAVRAPALAFVLASLALPLAAQALIVRVGSPYGEPLDVVPTVASLAGQGGWLDCGTPPASQRAGTVFTITVRRFSDPAPPSGCGNVDVDLGVLPRGRYRLLAIEHDAASGRENERRVLDFDVGSVPGPGRCALLPELVPQLWVRHATLGAAAFVARLASDRAYAARLGHPSARASLGGDVVWLTYPPLDDPTLRHYRLTQTGEFAHIGRNGYVYGVPPGDSRGTFVEFRHAGLDHYFYTADEDEIAAIDAGRVGPWQRTGETFVAYTRLGYVYDRPERVGYRFTGAPDIGPSTHLFTVDREECFALAQDPRWLFEGLPLAASPPALDGTCPVPGEVALQRLWKPFGVSNHRFTTRAAVVEAMVARGWVAEGAAMCVLQEPR